MSLKPSGGRNRQEHFCFRFPIFNQFFLNLFKTLGYRVFHFLSQFGTTSCRPRKSEKSRSLFFELNRTFFGQYIIVNSCYSFGHVSYQFYCIISWAAIVQKLNIERLFSICLVYACIHVNSSSNAFLVRRSNNDKYLSVSVRLLIVIALLHCFLSSHCCLLNLTLCIKASVLYTHNIFFLFMHLIM